MPLSLLPLAASDSAPDAAPDTAPDTSPDSAADASRRRPGPSLTRLFLPLALMAVIGAALGYVFLTSSSVEPAPLGASVQVPGGVARVNGVIPLEADGWRPNPQVEELSGPPAPGVHRVRVLLQVTATQPGGVSFRAVDYRIGGLGTARQDPLWSSPVTRMAARGETVNATLVYEVPDQAVSLVLHGPAGSGLNRSGPTESVLALGPGHHRGG